MKSEWKGPTVPVADKDLWTRFAAVCSALHLKRRGVAADLLAVAMKEWLDLFNRGFVPSINLFFPVVNVPFNLVQPFLHSDSQ